MQCTDWNDTRILQHLLFVIYMGIPNDYIHVFFYRLSIIIYDTTSEYLIT